VTRIPSEARDGLMRVWLALLSERHPDVSWVALDQKESSDPGFDEQHDPACKGSDGATAEDEILIAAA
jgi:hypothetical protein